MGNPIFSQNIAELTPIPEFIKRDVFHHPAVPASSGHDRRGRPQLPRADGLGCLSASAERRR